MPVDSLYWLLQEPLTLGAWLDVAGSGLMRNFLMSGLVALSHLGDLFGPDLQTTNSLAKHQGLRSIRTAAHLLQRWNSHLSDEEMEMLADNSKVTEEPGEMDSFPELILFPFSEGHPGCFIKCENTTYCIWICILHLVKASTRLVWKNVMVELIHLGAVSSDWPDWPRRSGHNGKHCTSRD